MTSQNPKRRLDATLLIVEDDPVASTNLKRYFAPFFKKIWVCSTATDAWDAYEINTVSVIISDIELPHGSGIEFIQKVRKYDAKCVIFIITAFPKEGYLLDAIALKLEDFVLKPLSSSKLQSILNTCNKLLLKEEVCLDAKRDVYYSYTKKIISSPQGSVAMTHLEITIFEALLEARNTILPYAELERTLEVENSFSRNSLRVLIARIRKKHPSICIENNPYEGYMLRC